MTGEEAGEYVGHAWAPGGTGPEEWDCWNFMTHILTTYFGKKLPDAPIGDVAGCRAVYDEEMKAGRWRRVTEPQHGDAVSMREGQWPHVGVYLDIDGGKVIHCMEGHGVIANKLNMLHTMGFGRVKFYRIES